MEAGRVRDQPSTSAAFSPLHSPISFKPLIDSIPIEADSERKKRKAEKYVEYEVLETIPGQIRAAINASGKKKSVKNTAPLAVEELIMQWLLVLP